MRVSIGVIAATWLAACSPVGAATSTVGSAGQVILDGKAVVPMSVFTQPSYLFEYHRQMGIDSIFRANPERLPGREALDPIKAAAAKGLGVISPFEPSRVDEPAVWAWLGSSLAPGRMEQINGDVVEIRKADRSRMIFGHIDAVTLLDGKQAKFYAEAMTRVDAVLGHPWPGLYDAEKRDLRMVGRFVDEVRRLCDGRDGGEVSIWVEINPHAWQLAKRHGGRAFPAPSRAELRYEIFLALIRGADGIIIFPISFDPFVYSQITAQNEKEIAACAKLIRRMTPVLTAGPSMLTIDVKTDNDGKTLDVATRTLDGRHYVFALNGPEQDQQVTLTLPARPGGWKLADAVKDEPIPLTGTRHTDRLAPLALRIWEISPAEPTDQTQPRGDAGKVADTGKHP